MVITGNGFSAGVEVYIGGIKCYIVELITTQLKIRIPEFTTDDVSH